MNQRRTLGGAAAAVAASSVLALPALVAPVASAAPTAAGSGGTALYIVQFRAEPVANYTGGVRGIAGTRPAKGKKLNMRAANAKAYVNLLRRQHSSILGAAGLAKAPKVRDYTTSFNGVALKLTSAQAAKLAGNSTVARVWKDEVRTADTTSTPASLGLSGANGVWAKQFGSQKYAGAGMIVGVIDSGIWPENPSFAALPDIGDGAEIASKWNGVCDGGTGQWKVTCNNKLIGARFYHSSVTPEPFEYLNPRGYNAHGTHTASTAAGNADVPATVYGTSVGTISGMAPAAKIAAYKALWATPDGEASGGTADLVAAIDQAVADGVDVINYSVSGSSQYVVSPDEIAFLNAAAANVLVSASAGNSGDTTGRSSVAHNSPWEITVAASTTQKPVAKTVILGNGATYSGVGIGDAVGPASVIDSSEAALPGADPVLAQRCYSDGDEDIANGVQGILDPAKVKGKIVVCTRGGNARADKGEAVANAGGIGMIQVNATDEQSLNADYMRIPFIHVNASDGAKIRDYVLGNAGATATISAQSTAIPRAPEIGGFSSWGPAKAAGGDLLKPDIAAPGVDIVAAASPMTEHGNDFASMSGTSMAAPHIAGIALLIKQAHHDWSPMAVKSAMMTSATTLDNTGQAIQRNGHPATALDMGSGQVVPAAAMNPGLVFDSSPREWQAWACGIGQLQLVTDEGVCDSLGSIPPSNLNYPSIAVGQLAGSQTVTRYVRNVGSKPMRYVANVAAPQGTTVTVKPNRINLRPNESAVYQVTITRTNAALGAETFGSMSWVGANGTTVRSPIVVRPVGIAGLDEVTVTPASGKRSFPGTSGVSGRLQTTVSGLAPEVEHAKQLSVGQTQEVSLTAASGDKVIRFATYDADYPAGTDVDIEVKKDGAVVGSSGGATAEEEVTLTDPEPGTYVATVTYFAGPAPQPITLHSFQVPAADAGNLTAAVSPSPAVLGRPVSLDLTWSVAPGRRYLGVVGYADAATGAALTETTLVSVTG